MKRQYQISKRRAAERFEQWAKSNPVPIQLTFPTAGIAELAQHSLGDRMRSVGKIFIFARYGRDPQVIVVDGYATRPAILEFHARDLSEHRALWASSDFKNSLRSGGIRVVGIHDLPG